MDQQISLYFKKIKCSKQLKKQIKHNLNINCSLEQAKEMHFRETSEKRVFQFWWRTYKEDADCGKKNIYLHDFHRTCVFSAGFEWDLNESTGKGSQGRCVLMIAAPDSQS